MGLTYCPRNKSIDAFDVNVCGADILGGIHHALGLPVYASRFAPPYRAPFSMKAKEARAAAKLLATKTDDEINAVIKDEHLESCWGDSLDEFVKWTRSWGNFLQNCSGYKVPG